MLVVVAQRAPRCLLLFTWVLLSSQQLLTLSPIWLRAYVCVHVCMCNYVCICVHVYKDSVHVPAYVCVCMCLCVIFLSHCPCPIHLMSRALSYHTGRGTSPGLFGEASTDRPLFYVVIYFDHHEQHHRCLCFLSFCLPSLLGSLFLLEFAFLPLFYFLFFLLTETRARPSSPFQDLLQTSR